MPTSFPGALDTFADKKVIDLEDGLQAVQAYVLNRSGIAAVVEHQPSWDPIAANHDAALNEARTSVTAGRILLPPLLKIAAVHDFGNGLDLVGRGSRQGGGASQVQRTAANACFRFGTTAGGTAAATSGGVSGGFHMDGGGLAGPLISIGIAVGRTFQNIDLTNSSTDGMLLDGTQNCHFMEVNTLSCDRDAVVLDRGAATNQFDKCEFGDSGRYNCNFQSTGTLTGLVSDPINNSFRTCLFEYSQTSTLAMLHLSAGHSNLFDHCTFATGTVGSPVVIIIEGTATHLLLDYCTVQHNYVSTATVGIDIIGHLPRVFGDLNHIVGSHTGIRRTTTLGGNVSYLGRVIRTGVTVDKSTPAGAEAFINAEFI